VQTANEIRTAITNQIVEALTNCQLPPWRKPWSNDPNAHGLHSSLSSRKPYRGINQLLLQLAADRHGFNSKWWGTFPQVRSSGGSVRRGEKGTQVVLYKPVKRTRLDENGEEKDDGFRVLKTFVVFNVEQTTGLDEFRVGFGQPQEDTTNRHEQADTVIEETGADIRYGGNRAFHSPDGDFIQSPHRHQFVSPEAFYETMFHELCHWSEGRVGFDRSKPGNTYAFGELVAEIGACFLMGELGMAATDDLTNQTAYLQHWLKGMNGDPSFIFKASSQASKAAEFILSFSRTPKPATEDVLSRTSRETLL